MRFLNLQAIAAVCVATSFLVAPLAHAGPGDPLPGTSVGLEHDPEGLRVDGGTTDGKGSVTFGKLASGRYVVFLPDASKLKVPVVIVISGTKPITSVPILPGKADKAYALDNNGRRLTVTIDKAGGEFTITVTEAASR